MADLSKLSTEDLLALKSGDLTKVSDAGLLALKGAPAMTSEQPAPRGTFGQNLLMDTAQRLATGGPLKAFGGATWDLMNKGQDMYADAANEAGARTTDAAMAMGANPNVAAGVGTGVNVAMNALPMVGGGGAIGKAAAPAMRGMAENLMQSAIKPIWKDLKTGEGKRAVQTMLDEGINATNSGLNKLRSKIEEINAEIENLIKGSSATVDKREVAKSLQSAADKFAYQVSPQGDLDKINAVGHQFMNNPTIPSNNIPVELAQRIKQGTYRVLSGKYGEVGSAEDAAQKAIARGLKEKIADAVPEVSALNARESNLLSALSVAERRILYESNKNPMGLALIASDPKAMAAFMLDRSAAFKSVIARILNAGQEAIPAAAGAAVIGAGQAVNQAGRKE